MIIYQSTKKGFVYDVQEKDIEQVILARYKMETNNKVSESEVGSWKRSLRYMRDVLKDVEIPEDVGVTIEYKIPQTSNRIDFILSGEGENSQENVVIVELKQWEHVELSGKDAIVRTDFYGGSEVLHPSYQVWSYKALLEGFNETVYEEKINLHPCAYLHNYIEDDVIRNDFYLDYLTKAPVFLEGDDEKQKLRNFIKKFVKFGDKTNIMYRIDQGKIKPSKSLADSLAKMIKGNQEFVMIDAQKIVYENALALIRKSSAKNKNVLIVQGGPGTGKSVVAINLLVETTKKGFNSRYITKNSAPRGVYESLLTGVLRKTQFSNLFSGSGSFVDTEHNIFDALIVDEAHRLNEKSGMFKNKGENQIKEIINASTTSIFFIDEDQKVTWGDIGDLEEIEKWAAKCNAKVTKLELKSQFRCNGSDGYLAWLDDVLQLRETANVDLSNSEYDFRIFDSPDEMHDLIIEKNKERNKARIVAGYCWNWISKKNKWKSLDYVS